MDSNQFNAILESKLEESRVVLAAKAAEYAHGDRLSNFKRAGEFLGCTPEAALWGFVSKHIIALGDFIAALDKGHVMTKAQWDEKTGDIRNYMILLDALLAERGVT